MDKQQVYCLPSAYLPWLWRTHLHHSFTKKCLLLVDDARQIESLRQAAEFYCPGVQTAVIAPKALRHDELLSLHPAHAAQRIRSFYDIAYGKAQLVLMTKESAFEKWPPAHKMIARIVKLLKGTQVCFQALRHELVERGYCLVDLVRTYGEFAVRGDIIDVYSPAFSLPVRLEFFDSVLERVSLFDPVTQRRQSEIDGLEIMPASFVTSHPSMAKDFADRCAQYVDDAGVYYPYLSLIHEGKTWPGMEQMLPLFFQEECVSVFELLRPNLLLIQGQLEQALDEFKGSLSSLHYEDSLLLSIPLEKRFVCRLDEVTAWVGQCFEATHLRMMESQDSAFHPLPPLVRAGQKPESRVTLFVSFLQAHLEKKETVVILCQTAHTLERMKHLLQQFHISVDETEKPFWGLSSGAVYLRVLPAEAGFVNGSVFVYTESEIFGARIHHQAQKAKRSADAIFKEFSQLCDGDYVVHKDHGVGQYAGLELIQVGGCAHDCLKILYAEDHRLFLPVENIDLISRYGQVDGQVILDRLGSSAWQKRQARVRKKIQEIAEKIIAIAAQRQSQAGEICTPAAGLFDEFCALFPYPETDDQLNAVEDVLSDLNAGVPMDRLVCGDVGFGKTEVALRAAFIVAMSGAQVAVVVPTTLLCRQHEASFKGRFEAFGLKVAALSRLKSSKEIAHVKDALQKGEVHVLIATHALFAKDVHFNHLGLLIIDEEHHFGVMQKEKIKQKYPHVHILAMTATPIPRTLHMALTGVRQMSLIATPPLDRLSVITHLTPFVPQTIRQAIHRELQRGGQVFYISPRLEELKDILKMLEQLVPEARISMAHGQMRPCELENVMSGFYNQECDILLSTSIVESGIDMPSANTIIIHRADLLGMAQLYQLRGRVGRGQIQGYAYLLLPNYELKDKALRRLSLLESLDTLGAGFTLASHDMDMRGVGNLVGEEQSGHVKEVGVELYQAMLAEALSSSQNKMPLQSSCSMSPQLNLGVPIFIPDTYVQDRGLRLGLYRRAGHLKDEASIDAFAEELVDRFGVLPESAVHFLEVLKIKALCIACHVDKIDVGSKGIVVQFYHNTFPHPEKLIKLAQQASGALKIRPDHKISLLRAWPDLNARIQGIKAFVARLASFCQ